MSRLIVPACVSAVLFLLIVATAPAATLKVGPKRQFAMPSQAIRAAKDGDTIEIDAGAYQAGTVGNPTDRPAGQD